MIFTSFWSYVKLTSSVQDKKQNRIQSFIIYQTKIRTQPVRLYSLYSFIIVKEV